MTVRRSTLEAAVENAAERARTKKQPTITPRPRAAVQVAAKTPPGRKTRRLRRKRAARAAAVPSVTEARAPNESVSAIYSAAGCHQPADGGHFARRLCRVPATAGVRVAAGGLSHHSGAHVLPRRQSRRDGVFYHRAAGAPVRTNPRIESDDVDELLRKLDRHAAVFA